MAKVRVYRFTKYDIMSDQQKLSILYITAAQAKKQNGVTIIESDSMEVDEDRLFNDGFFDPGTAD